MLPVPSSVLRFMFSLSPCPFTHLVASIVFDRHFTHPLSPVYCVSDVSLPFVLLFVPSIFFFFSRRSFRSTRMKSQIQFNPFICGNYTSVIFSEKISTKVLFKLLSKLKHTLLLLPETDILGSYNIYIKFQPSFEQRVYP